MIVLLYKSSMYYWVSKVFIKICLCFVTQSACCYWLICKSTTFLSWQLGEICWYVVSWRHLYTGGVGVMRVSENMLQIASVHNTEVIKCWGAISLAGEATANKHLPMKLMMWLKAVWITVSWQNLVFSNFTVWPERSRTSAAPCHVF